MVSDQQVLQSYRILYRYALRAVQYSTPARYIVRNHLRKAFRDCDRKEYNQQKIDNTVEFLHNAAKMKDIEHKVLKNILHIWWWEESRRNQTKAYV